MALKPTPTDNTLPLRAADFSNLADALDFAALGQTGLNFYTARGELYAAMPYSQLREQAQLLARQLLALGLQRGSRVILVADTSPDFVRFFFACQYAGLVPVPVPVPISLGSRRAYIELLRGMIESSAAAVVMAPSGYLPFVTEAAAGLELAFVGDPEAFGLLPASEVELQPSGSDELAYLQYTSGSTRFPRGVMITQETVLSNLAGIIIDGVKVRPGDRAVSWLPFYHDMGLVGLLLVPIASQCSADYLGTQDFAMRPRQWLSLISQNRCTIAFSPPFGYELCARRLRPGEAEQFDLSSWRIAGVGAEMVNPEILERFATALAPSGFDKRAFLPCYGMAECSVAASFSPLDTGVVTDRVDAERLAQTGEAVTVGANGSASDRVNVYVDCGAPLPGFEVEIRDDKGRILSERRAGSIFLKGASVMSGYFGNPEITAQCLSADGWLDTGDIGYRAEGRLFITGRRKDLIIINGRNIWPQDLEYLAQQQPEVRSGDCLAFSVPGSDSQEITVMVVQCRENDVHKRQDLVGRLQALVREELTIDCHIELVPLHTLPRTSSGKLSRSKARQNFIESHTWKSPAFAETRAVEPQLRASAG